MNNITKYLLTAALFFGSAFGLSAMDNATAESYFRSINFDKIRVVKVLARESKDEDNFMASISKSGGAPRRVQIGKNFIKLYKPEIKFSMIISYKHISMILVNGKNGVVLIYLS